MRRLVRKHWAGIAIVALLALNVVLIAPLLINRSAVPSPVVAAGTTPVAGSNSPTSGSPGPSPTSDPSAPTGAALQSGRPRRLLAVNSDRVAWRAEPAACGENSKLEVTTDGGKTWRSTDSGLQSVLRLKAFGDSSVFAIGADKNCKPAYASVASPDGAWQRDDSMLANTWFRMPDDLNTVHDPQGNKSHPCDNGGLVDLAGLGSHQAAAICGDGSLHTRKGSTWRTAIKSADAVAVNADDNRFVMVQHTSTCQGWSVLSFRLRHKLKANKRHCVEMSATDPNNVAVSNQRRAIWVWSGGVVKH